MKKLLKKGLGIVLPILIVFMIGCDKSDGVNTSVPKVIKIATSATLGNYLTDKDGRTLYYFSNDFNGQNNCAGACEAIWPYYTVDNLTAEQLGDSLKITDFTNLVAANGKKQLAYKGWPLYYYAPAIGGVNTLEAPGLTGGENVGGVWFVAKPDYTIMLVSNQLLGSNGKMYKSDYTEGTGKTIYFTDGKGVTLYSFRNDKANKNNYTKSDFSNNAVWPLYEQTKVVVPSSIDKSLFNSIDVFGRKQLTYKGWPLYYFDQDSTIRGRNKGFTFPSLGVWPVVTKDVSPAAP